MGENSFVPIARITDNTFFKQGAFDLKTTSLNTLKTTGFQHIFLQHNAPSRERNSRKRIVGQWPYRVMNINNVFESTPPKLVFFAAKISFFAIYGAPREIKLWCKALPPKVFLETVICKSQRHRVPGREYSTRVMLTRLAKQTLTYGKPESQISYPCPFGLYFSCLFRNCLRLTFIDPGIFYDSIYLFFEGFR